jgi:hypothetical protein
LLVPAAIARLGWVAAGLRFIARLAAYELEYHVRADDGGGAGLENPAEAIMDPPTGLGWGFDQEASFREIEGAECIEPDAVGRLVDGRGKLDLYA